MARLSKLSDDELSDIANKLCRTSLAAFARRAWPVLEGSVYEHNWHIDCVAEHLEAVVTGDLKRLMIFIPPRTLKTYLANICFSGWALGRDPGKKIVGISYSHRLSEKIAFRSRVLMESPWYQSLFPETVLDKDQTQKANFMTTKGGGRFSTSVGGTLTGEGGNILIFDDPMNPQDAGSDIKRESVNDWVDQVAYSRLNNPKDDAIVCIMQRVHPDDTAAHMMSKNEWTTLTLPAETNKKIIVDFGKKRWEYEGLLHPNRLTQEVLDGFKGPMGPFVYNAQYLQDPRPLEGGLFNRDLINLFRTSDFSANRCNIYITVDPANSKKKTSDYTAIAVWALAPDRNYYLIDGVKERLDPTERIDKLFEIHRKWNDITGKPPRVGYEEYGLMSDIHFIEQKQKEESYRFQITQIKTKLSKEERIIRLISIMASAQMWLPNDIYVQDEKGLSKPFINDIIEQEMLLFPYAAHDDFIDAMSMIFDMSTIFPKSGQIKVSHDYLDNNNEPQSVYDL